MARLAQINNVFSADGFDATEKKLLSLKSPAGWPTPLLSNDSGIKVNEKRSLAHTGVWRCLSLLAGALASQPKHVFHKPANGSREVARLHPANRLISKKPNGFQNSFVFWAMATVHAKLWGNFYAGINRNEFFEPVSIIPFQPWKVTTRIENNKKVFFVGGRRIEDEDMIHVMDVMTIDGFTGLRPIHYMSENIGTGLAADKMIASGFGKGLHAGGVMTMPEDAGGQLASTNEEAEQEMAKIRESIRQTYQDGPTSWHNLLLLEPGWKFEQFKLHFAIDQLVTVLKFNLADIARMFGVPLHKLMELDRATNNNIEHQGIEFSTDGVLPLTTSFEAEFNVKLLREDQQDEYYTKFNLDGLQRGDIKTRYEAYTMALGARSPGWMEPAEIRDLEDQPDGNPENWAVPKNMTGHLDNDNTDNGSSN